MQPVATQITQLTRPNLLLRAARIGEGKYRRAIDLKRILKREETPRTLPGLMALLDLERAMNHLRTCNSYAYSYQDHIDVLIALRAETARYFSQIGNKKDGPREPPDLCRCAPFT
ncbi:hypothetical protein GG681_01875 [Epibacterium sp. SM1969]|uniref:Uncharacterized protein n=1 Tax=Tritonibacter aquimaris TaxID=2663379 RepID=A0A844AJW6_9RHOB|nr:DUF6477 family protein [Tritonibacter aquimaris]MQY41375.1 hypothetical protein [Tritonibacter aquimaris]